jgi:hypothetical protein
VFADVSSSDEAKLRWVVAGVIVFQSAVGGYWVLNALAGAIRMVRGLRDLGEPVMVEGEVVKVHGGRVAVDDGRSDETIAWFPPAGAPGLSRGDRVRVTRSPSLHYVTRVEVL